MSVYFNNSNSLNNALEPIAGREKWIHLIAGQRCTNTWTREYYNLIDMDLIFFKHNKHWEIFSRTFFRFYAYKKKYWKDFTSRIVNELHSFEVYWISLIYFANFFSMNFALHLHNKIFTKYIQPRKYIC